MFNRDRQKATYNKERNETKLNLLKDSPILNNRCIKNVAFLGLGRIGLPQSLVFANKGFHVVGFDVNPLVIESLIKKELPFHEPHMQQYLDNTLHNKFFPEILHESSYTTLRSMDAVIFTIGTPVSDMHSCISNKKLDLSIHYSIIDKLFSSPVNPNIVFIFRTTFPLGSMDEIKNYIESKYTLKEGRDFHLVFVPERLMEGRAILEEETLPKIVGTYNDEAFHVVKDMFKKIGGEVIRVDNPKTAEFCKLADNAYRSTIFAFANDLAMYGNEQGINVLSVIYAVNYGYLRNNIPLPGFVSGYCLGKDPYILETGFKDKLKHRFFPSVWHQGRLANDYLVDYVVGKVLENIPPNQNNRVTILGLSFKEDIDDFRMSHSLEIIKKLNLAGIAYIDVYDPALNKNLYTQLPNHLFLNVDRRTNELRHEFFKDSQAIIVCHRHKALLEFVSQHKIESLLMQIKKPCYVFDAWNIWSDIKTIEGIHYEGLGYPNPSLGLKSKL